MKNVTEEYSRMLSAFSCDLAVASKVVEERQGIGNISFLPMVIPLNTRTKQDIELFHKLETKIRYGQIKIMEL